MRLCLFFYALCLGFIVNVSVAQPLMLGIDVLERRGFAGLEGKRVGLLTHQAGLNRRGVSSVDVLRRSPRVNLVALFGPEHGFYGIIEASESVEDDIDPRTGLPVFSLYGKYRSPSKEMLDRIDVMVIDLQDIGVRSYTFISCMRWTVDACFKHGVEVMILDRPNPLGGLKVAGPGLDAEWESYVGAFQVPYVHGLTIGELALMAKDKPGWFKVDERHRTAGKLTVIPMEGWRRRMLWPDTGLKFAPTSPNIPDVSAVLGYSMVGLGAQVGGFSHGIGTPYPFRLLRYKGKSAKDVQSALVAKRIPGLSFPIIQAKTKKGATIEGVYVRVDDFQSLDPLEISFHMMQITAAWAPRAFTGIDDKEAGLFNKHTGSQAWWDEISTRGSRARVGTFLNAWREEAIQFQQESKRYWLYQK
ncbi:MAG: DUF1343 domain-containing protein [Opitutales bacterium]